MSGEFRAQSNNEPTVVQELAERVVQASLELSDSSLDEAESRIQDLIAELDVLDLDESDPEYRYKAGVADALVAVIDATYDSLPDAETSQLLQDRLSAKLLAKVASRTSVSLAEITEGLGYDDEKEEDQAEIELCREALVGYINGGMVETETIEPDATTWKLTDWGKTTYLRLIPQIAGSAGLEPAIHGLRGVLTPPPSADL